MNDYVVPVHADNGFNCPHCKAFAEQIWYLGHWFFPLADRTGDNKAFPGLTVAHCRKCLAFSIWVSETMVYPRETTAPKAHKQMPEAVRTDYLEASEIVSVSPRAAAALLRLATERLATELEPDGHDLNAKIGNLVKLGLPAMIQKALDVLRVTGNETVHPGQIDLNDTPDVAQKLFVLLNRIVENQIAGPAEVEELYESLPEEKRKAIERRDQEPPDNPGQSSP